MTRYTGGTQVSGGYYFNLKHWGFEAVSGEAGALPGGPEDRYLRVPTLLMVPAVALLSFAFVVFLPFIGFALVAWVLARKLAHLARAGTASVAGTFAPSWRPGEAYFADRAEEEEKAERPEAPAAEEPLDELSREVEERARAEADEEP